VLDDEETILDEPEGGDEEAAADPVKQDRLLHSQRIRQESRWEMANGQWAMVLSLPISQFPFPIAHFPLPIAHPAKGSSLVDPALFPIGVSGRRGVE
jgi:hypothetical protein